MYKTDLINYTVSINSKDRLNANEDSSFIRILVKDLININSRKSTFLSLSQLILPPTINNVSSKIGNNTLEITENTIPSTIPLTYTITFPDGNYNQSTFSNNLVSLLNAGSAGSGYAQTYSTSFDSETGKITLSMVGLPVGFTFAITFNGPSQVLNEFMGFPNREYTDFTVQAVNAQIISAKAVNYAYPQAIYLRSNKMRIDGNYDTSLGNQNTGQEGNRGGTGDILKIIPIESNGYSSVIYNRTEGIPDQRLDISNLLNGTMELRLTDQFNNLIDLNNYDWIATLLVQYSREAK
jgi:hypothetical protein